MIVSSPAASLMIWTSSARSSSRFSALMVRAPRRPRGGARKIPARRDCLPSTHRMLWLELRVVEANGLRRSPGGAVAVVVFAVVRHGGSELHVLPAAVDESGGSMGQLDSGGLPF